MKINRIKKWSLITGLVLLCLIVVSLFVRNYFLSLYLGRKLDRFNSEYNASLRIEHARIRGFSNILFTGITLKPKDGDTLISIDTASADLNFTKLIFGHNAAKNLKLKKVRIKLLQLDSTSNYQFLLKKHKGAVEDSAEKRNYSKLFNSLATGIFDRLPASLNISDISIIIDKNGHKLSFHTDHFTADRHAFHTPFIVSEDNTSDQWIFAGNFDNEKHSTAFRIYSADGGKIRIPFLNYAFKAEVDFDTLTFLFAQDDKRDEMFHVKGITLFRGLEIRHEKIANDKVAFDRLGVDYAVNIGKDFFEIDSATEVFFNKLSFHPYVRYRPKPSKQLKFSILKPDFPASELFSSLPEGLFTTLNGIKVNGNLSFNIDFFVDLSIPDSLKFDVELKRNKFSVVSYGSAGLTKLNDDFEYTAYEHGIPARSFIVGPENPEFRRLDQISGFFQVSVLNSEDPSFYLHRGFIMDAFRESVIKDIKERRFARGGSTITMQLVKNVFLTRNKTVSRKLEEIILVWLLENQQICPKERMFEVYLNIIELGPGVYGAEEASRFYFRKEASKLNLQESIFLASIIPKPKWFMYSFDKSGNLNQSTKDFFSLLAGKMLRKDQITQEDYDKLVFEVDLKGPAKKLLKTEVPMPADTADNW